MILVAKFSESRVDQLRGFFCDGSRNFYPVVLARPGESRQAKTQISDQRRAAWPQVP